MILNPTPDQQELRASTRSFLEKLSPIDKVRELQDSADGHDPEVWQRLATELGVPSLAVSESGGGAGFGLTELCLVMEEAGAVLLPGPLVGSGVVAAQVLDALGETEVLPGVLAGETLAAVVQVPDLLVSPDGALIGTGQASPGAAEADLLVVLGAGAAYLVRPGADVERTPLSTLDLGRRQAQVHLAGATATRIGSADDARRGLQRARIALAAESVGVLRRSLELAVAYAGEREQFGRAIGSYQGVKHMLADMHADYELTGAVVAWAAWVAEHEPESLELAADLCQGFVFGRVFTGTFQMIQTFGGIGFTWEHDAHLYFRRARSNESLLGHTTSSLVALGRHAAGIGEVAR